ncbi:NAC domain-containing protein 1 [Cardamine amara subsp. amara]|uniref:NAC domain-containing protein 1 n=1 Tax=Cardamine amara subsp. amara TaxID=228776 RepID=A0ABD1BT56_CARAN
MENQVGYGFRPNDEELVGFYLHNKIEGKTCLVEGAISEVNICGYDPWNLRFQSKYKSRDPMWYFFSRRDNKYGNGNRQNRTTISGKWKLTGDAVDVKDQWGTWCGTPGKKIGHKRVLVFLDGINTKSDWVIHEFHYELLPEHKRTYVICRLEYKGDDRSILFDSPTDLIPRFVANRTSSAGSVVNQSRQGNSGSYNIDYDSVTQGQQINQNFIMQQPGQRNVGSSNHSPVFDPTNHGQQFGGNCNMHQSVQGGYSEPFNPLPEFDSTNYGQWFSDFIFNPQQPVPYSDSSVDELGKMLMPIVEENFDFLVDERISMQEHFNNHQPKKPVTGVFADDSDSEIGSTIFEDTSSSTDSVGSSNEPDHTPIDDIPSLNTIEPLHSFEAQEQPKPWKLHLKGKEKVKNTQKSECEWKMAEDSIKKTPSTNTVKQSWIVLEKRSQRNAQRIYHLTNMIIGVLLFISIIGWIILVG